MKIVLSHDVDHLKYSEHFFRDLVVLKHLFRTYVEFGSRRITYSEFFNRHFSIFKNKMENVKEILLFNESLGVKSTFFFGMDRGLGLNYYYRDIQDLMRYVISRGHEIGLHGISFNDLDRMRIEKQRFEELSGLKEFGLRMHYLRTDDSTLPFLRQLNYLYDSSVMEFENESYKAGILQFPIHIMDCAILNNSAGYQSLDIDEAKAITIEKLDLALKSGIRYFSFLFHDCYFSENYLTWRNWYTWFVHYALDNGYQFVTYSQARAEIENLNLK